ncbi:MAG: N-acetyltransferase [Candidatus Aenigmarchaeota archaeon]|nr:N-acetyltransferase [Candidatus Aenigmarchaeota archaeon]
MNIQIRLENPKDFRETEELTRDAFWDVYKPGCDEHLVLHNLRKSPTFVRGLDFVAVLNGKIIGNIVYSKAKVIGEDKSEHEVLCLGPFCVAPEMQKKGIGSKLIRQSLSKAKTLGFRGVILFGSPEYYSRFGFKNAESYHITTPDGKNFDAFMALELVEGSLKGIEGRFFADSVFEVEAKDLEEFEKSFPFREKHVTDTRIHLD